MEGLQGVGGGSEREKPNSSSASAPVSAVATFWKDFDLEKERTILDEQGLRIAENQENSQKNRRKLAESTRDFKKASNEDKLVLFNSLLKGYQEEVDKLTKRAKFGENAFLNIYQKLYEAPDPYPVLNSVAEKDAKLFELESENRKMKVELEEFRTESTHLKNQQATIRRLEERTRQLEQQMEEKVKEIVEIKQRNLAEENQKTMEVLKERERMLQDQLRQAQESVSTMRKLHEFAQSQLFELRAQSEEERAGKQSEVILLMDEVEQAQTRLLSLEREKGLLRSQLESANEESGHKRSDSLDANTILENSLSAKEKIISELNTELHNIETTLSNEREYTLNELKKSKALLNEKGSALGVPSELSVKLSSVLVKARRPIHLKASRIKMELSITRPDDWHLHLRDGDLLEAVVPHSSQHFGRAIVMPNLRPPITTTAAAIAYRQSILKALPENSDFTPLMTLYLTDTTSPDEIKLARESGVVFAVKLYPAGATTNSQDGVTDLFGKCLPVLEEMVRQNMPLLVHGEVTNPDVDVFDREKVFIDTVLSPLLQKFPRLKVVMEHITTKDAADFVLSCDERFVAATVTPQHLVLSRNALFQGGLQPHNYCLPGLKRETHRKAIVSAVTSGSKRFFLGTDSAPHERRKKECSCGCAGIYNSPVALSVYAKVFEEAGALNKLEAFTSFNGPDFYGLPRNNSKIKLSKTSWTVPASFSFADGSIVPMFAGQMLEWLPSPV